MKAENQKEEFVEHAPAQPARKNHPEADYLRVWQALIEAPGVDKILFPDGLNQKRATTAASFMCWLGTSVGGSMLRTAKELIGKGVYNDSGLCHVLAWTLHNRRRPGSNLRIVETILARGDPLIKSTVGVELDRVNWPAVEAAAIDLDDQDTIERLLDWLATRPGQDYLCAAQAAADASRKMEGMLNRWVE